MRRVVTIGLIVLAVALLGATAWLYQPDRERGWLEARYAASPSAFLDVAGLRLHVRDTGPRDAPALILLHGFGASLHAWDDVAARLDQRFRVIRIDLPGFGLTGPDPGRDYSDVRTHAVLAALMDRLGLARAVFGGHSMGGRMAWGFAAVHPARVSHLVLIAPDGFASPGRPYGAAPRVPLLLRLLPYVLPTPLLRASLRTAYGDPAQLTEAVVQRTRDMLLAPGVRQAIVDRTGQHVLRNPVPLLRGIAVSVLLVWGGRDAMVPFTNAQDYLAALPDARLAEFPALGHVPHEEAPDAVADAIRAFLLP
jgi:pimeloyl-ACP methyl ester carboxylesterase